MKKIKKVIKEFIEAIKILLNIEKIIETIKILLDIEKIIIIIKDNNKGKIDEKYRKIGKS